MDVKAKEGDNALHHMEKRVGKKNKTETIEAEETTHYRGEPHEKIENVAEFRTNTKKKEKRKEKKGKHSDDPGVSSSVVVVNNNLYIEDDNKKLKKKRKFEYKRDEEGSNDVEIGSMNIKCNRKDKRHKEKEDQGSDCVKKKVVADMDSLNKKDYAGEDNHKRAIVASKDEETRKATKLDLSEEEKKKKKKEKRNRKENMSSSLEESVVDKNLEKCTETKQLKMAKKDMSIEIKDGENRNKEKKKKKKNKDTIEDLTTEVPIENLNDVRNTILDDNKLTKIKKLAGSTSKKRTNMEKEMASFEKKIDKDKRKKAKMIKCVTEDKVVKGKPTVRNKVGGADLSIDSQSEKTSKRVRFSGHVEVFPFDATEIEKKKGEDGLVHGIRFSPEEDKLIKDAVSNYIEDRCLGEEGVKMILNSSAYPEVRNCWKIIGTALPWRPYTSVFSRAHILLTRDESRIWTPEEIELIVRFHQKHGPDWKTLANMLGKNPVHVKDAWRRNKLPHQKRGHWTQEEYQTLFDLVHMDIRMKVFEEKKSDHRKLRDGISWEAISDKLSTRTNACCCNKWYNQLSSPLLADGTWINTDDYHLLKALFSLDAFCEEDVDWDKLLDHRPGDICRKRWKEMVRHTGEYGNRPFSEQIDVLAKRYCPELLEVRQALDNRPVVP